MIKTYQLRQTKKFSSPTFKRPRLEGLQAAADGDQVGGALRRHLRLVQLIREDGADVEPGVLQVLVALHLLRHLPEAIQRLQHVLEAFVVPVGPLFAEDFRKVFVVVGEEGGAVEGAHKGRQAAVAGRGVLVVTFFIIVIIFLFFIAFFFSIFG